MDPGSFNKNNSDLIQSVIFIMFVGFYVYIIITYVKIHLKNFRDPEKKMIEIKNDYPHYFQELRLSSSASYFTLVFMLTRFVVPYV